MDYRRRKFTQRSEFKSRRRQFAFWIALTHLEKVMNRSILSPAIIKESGRLGSVSLVRQPVQEKKNSEFKPVKLFKKLLLSHPARTEVSVHTYTH